MLFCVHCGCSMNDGLKRARPELARQEMKESGLEQEVGLERKGQMGKRY